MHKSLEWRLEIRFWERNQRDDAPICSSALPQPLQSFGWRQSDRFACCAGQRARHDRVGDHRPWESVRRTRVLRGLQRRGNQPDRRLRGVCSARQPFRAKCRRPRRNELPSHRAGGESHGLREFDQALKQGFFGGFLSQAADRPRAARGSSRGTDLFERLRLGRAEPDAAFRQHGR